MQHDGNCRVARTAIIISHCNEDIFFADRNYVLVGMADSLAGGRVVDFIGCGVCPVNGYGVTVHAAGIGKHKFQHKGNIFINCCIVNNFSLFYMRCNIIYGNAFCQ